MSFMTTVYPSCDGYFQQMCHVTKAQIVSNWFLEHDNEFTTLIWPPKSPDPNPTEHVGYSGTGDSSWIAADKSGANA